ncbi:MAG: RNA polymerase sigma factor [Lachnospiraceae bacterium]|nr:RNA polymerase sigma factor [Lachnospiraceae bacterium]
MPQKDDKLLHDLIEKYARLFAKHAYRYGVPYDDVEDVVYDAIWTFYQSEHYGKKDEIETRKILATIVKRKSIDFFRREKDDEEKPIDIDDEEIEVKLVGPARYEPEHVVIESEGYGRILSVIEGLKPVWRDTVKMYFIEERSYTEISEALGISEEVCRKRISRARKYLEIELKDLLE